MVISCTFEPGRIRGNLRKVSKCESCNFILNMCNKYACERANFETDLVIYKNIVYVRVLRYFIHRPSITNVRIHSEYLCVEE